MHMPGRVIAFPPNKNVTATAELTHSNLMLPAAVTAVKLQTICTPNSIANFPALTKNYPEQSVLARHNVWNFHSFQASPVGFLIKLRTVSVRLDRTDHDKQACDVSFENQSHN
jgi:hypothetical protein